MGLRGIVESCVERCEKHGEGTEAVTLYHDYFRGRFDDRLSRVTKSPNYLRWQQLFIRL